MSEKIEMEYNPDNLPDSLQLEDLLNSLKNDEYHNFESIVKRILLSECDETRHSQLENLPLTELIIEFKETHKETLAKITNHLYGDPENKTLLDIACSNTNRAPYVKILLKLGADVNQKNEHFHRAAPVHFAVLHSDLDTFELLMDHRDTKIYQRNGAGKTAFHLAAQQGKSDFMSLLLWRQATDIKEKKINFWRNGSDMVTFSEYLQTHLNCLLTRTLNDIQSSKNDTQEYTSLQYACKNGDTKSVEDLLNSNVDPNETNKFHSRTPITIAASNGYDEIVQLLINTGIIEYDLIEGENILHSTMHGFYYIRTVLHSCSYDVDFIDHPLFYNQINRNYAKCLELILNNVPIEVLDVNSRDANGNTPLLYAILLDERDIIFQLFERGAYIGLQCGADNDIAPIKRFQPATLEYFLDKISTITSISSMNLKNYHCLSYFNYNLLTYDESDLNETKPLVDLSEVPELKPLLLHPFFLVYLDFKWHIIVQKLYRTNLIIFILFFFFLSIYLLTVDIVASGYNIISASGITFVLWCLVFTFNTIVFLREFIQCLIDTKINKYRYVKDVRNWLDITLIVIVYLILFGQVQSIKYRALSAAAAIFLSYVELMLLILSHTRISIYIEMFKVVALNYLKFLMSYQPLILAFAFGFYILFNEYSSSKNTNWKYTNLTETNLTDTNSKNSNSKYKPFAGILPAIFKTIITAMGEYDLSDILINDEYGIRHMIFILFIFLIPIVLFNLLNAIAVSDIKRIRKDAELLSTVARVKLIAHMEEIIHSLSPFIERMDKYYNTLVRRKSKHRMNIYYYTNYFSTVDENERIIYLIDGGKCLSQKDNKSVELNFNISPCTKRSLITRAKLFEEARKKEEVNSHCTAAKITKKTSTLQEVCENLMTLKHALEETGEENTNEVEQIAKEILASIEKQREQKHTSNKE